MGLLSHLKQSSRQRTRTILIVEDEPLVAFDNEHALGQAGYRVVDTVDRYEHAVDAMAEALAEGGVDLVVADIRLAGTQDGMDVARHAGSLGIAVLFSTADCPAEAHPLAVGYLAKPYAPRDLVRAIAVVDAVLSGKSPRTVPDTMTLFLPPSIP